MHDDPLARLATRLRDELRAATGPAPDMEQLQRRRTTRRVATVAAAVVVVALVSLPQMLGGLEGLTIDPVAPGEDPAVPDEPLDGGEVGDPDLDVEVPVRVLAVRFNNPSLAAFDLDNGRTMMYPPGSHGLPGDAISGALVTTDGTIVVWQDDTVRVFTDRLDEPDFAYTPEELTNPAGTAPALRVLSTGDGRALWVVQIGFAAPMRSTARRTRRARDPPGPHHDRSPPEHLPRAILGDDLLLNTERSQPADSDTDAGWVGDPGSLRVLRLTPDGQLSELTDGQAVATSGSTVLVRTCDMRSEADGCALDLLDPASGERRPVQPDNEASLSTAAGPAGPGDFTPWEVVAPDGRILISRSIHDGIGNKPAVSQLMVLDPDTAEITEVARYDGPTPPAAWDRDGRYIVVADDRDLMIIDPTSSTTTITLENVIPEGHHVVGIG